MDALKKAKSRRKLRIRAKISGSELVPRVTIFKSNKHIYVQAINDKKSETLCSASTLKEKGNPGIELAKKLGADFSQKLKSVKLETVVFDRNGYKYHGIVKSFVDSLRENGINV